MVTVRVINDKNNKRKFEKRKVKDFPKYQILTELKTALISMFGHQLKTQHELKNIDVGYIGYSNKKYEITCDEDLKKAYESKRNDDPSKSPVFFMVEADEDTTSTDSDSGANFFQITLVQTTYAKIKRWLMILSKPLHAPFMLI